MSLKLIKDIWVRERDRCVFSGEGKEDQDTDEHVRLRDGKDMGGKLGI